MRSPIYFVTACTLARKDILANAGLHDSFLEFARCGVDAGAHVGRYVLTLAKCLKSLKNTLSKSLRRQGLPSPHWQKGFFDHVLRTGESYAQKWNYVSENPVRAGLVSEAGDWPFAGEIFPLEFLSDR